MASLVSAGHDLEFLLIGPEPPAMAELARILPGRLACTGYIPHDRAIEKLRQADILLNTVGAHRRNFGISSKLFEYLATARPIIAANSTEPDKELLEGRPGVMMLEAPDVEHWRRALEWALSELGNPRLHQAPRLGVEFARTHQVERLAGLLSALHATAGGTDLENP
jgi:glycosyltransferase involved in cell wall biosynthesis